MKIILYSTRSGANQGEGKQRSTSLPCRRNYAEVVEEINANPVAFVTGGNEQKEEFLGGPSDPSLLVSYVDHVAYKLWNGEVSIKFDFDVILMMICILNSITHMYLLGSRRIEISLSWS